MAGQACWYRAPGEDGLLRYWNGTIWTDHRQPVPAPSVPAVQPDPDPMAEYERQFSSEPAYAPVAATVSQPQSAAEPAFVAHDFAPHVAPISTIQAAPTAPEPTVVAPVAVVPVAPEPTVVVPALPEPAVVAPAVVAPIVPEPAVVAPAVAAPADRNRKSVFRAISGMGVGIVIVIIGIGLMLLFSANSSVGAGEVVGSGIVTSLGSTSGNSCAPIARFAVDGTSFAANSSSGISPCPVGLGQTVDVIYKASNPASNARVEMGTSVTQYLWLIPILGGVLFLAGLFTFIVRAGSVTGGIAMVRDRAKRSKEPRAPSELAD